MSVPENLSWLLQGEEDVPPGDGWLSPAEREIQAGLRLEKRRRDYRLGRWTAKQALLHHLSEGSPGELEILPAPDGAPEAWQGGRPCPSTLSISHSHGRGLALVGPAGLALGCDLEWIEPRSPAFIRDYLTADEQRYLAQAPKALHPLLANLFWSAKESAMKALREGLRLDTRSLPVCLGSPGHLPLSEEPGGDQIWHPLEVASPAGGSSFPGQWRRDEGWVLTLAWYPHET